MSAGAGAGAGERAGIVDIRDLANRQSWGKTHLESFLEDHGLAPDESSEVVRRLAPPRVLVVIGDWNTTHAALRRSRTWFGEVEHLIVVRIEPEVLDMRESDPDRRELLDQEWDECLETLGAQTQVELIDDPRAALVHAKELAAALPPRSKKRSEVRDVPPPDALPTSPWRAYEPKDFARRFIERIRRNGTEISIVSAPIETWGTAEEVKDPRNSNRGHLPLGSDPIHPNVGWRGSRMSVYWTWKGRFFSESDHDYPCGPGKKLWGFKDNDPVQVMLAPDTSMYAARFEHDVLITRAVPVPWQRAGDFDVHVKAIDPYRAVFYAQDPENDDNELYRDDDIRNEDSRECAPALVLAPNRHYALDLSLRVFRIMNSDGPDTPARVLMGGPEEGFAVFDAEHRLVRRASGRLLGGWYRHATIEHEGWYWREDLANGERARLAPVDFEISEDPSIEAVAVDAMLEGKFERAIELRRRGPTRRVDVSASYDDDPLTVYALPQTKNVLLVAKEHIRVI